MKGFFGKLFSWGLMFGLAQADKDMRFQAFKQVYNELSIGDLLLSLAKESDNDLDDKAVLALDSVLKDKPVVED